MIVIAALPRIPRLRLSATLSAYIARQFAWRWAALYLALGGVILLVSTVDILSHLANKEKAGLATIFKLALLKLPYLTQEVMPFAVLFAGMATFWRLTRDHELVVARAAGVSVWQFLLPVVAAALLIGVLTMTVLNPVASTLLGRFEQIESRFSDNPQRALTVSPNGLWLRQGDREGQSVIHAARMRPETTTLWQVIVFRFGPDDRFIGRIDAARAELVDKRWSLYDARRSDPGGQTESRPLIELETDLTAAKILDSFAPPESISFWSLPGFIRLLQEAGFSAQRHRLQLHKIAGVP